MSGSPTGFATRAKSRRREAQSILLYEKGRLSLG